METLLLSEWRAHFSSLVFHVKRDHSRSNPHERVCSSGSTAVVREAERKKPMINMCVTEFLLFVFALMNN